MQATLGEGVELRSAIAVLATGFSIAFAVSFVVLATSDQATVSVSVTGAIAISAPADVTMGTITGTGVAAPGSATWTVTTNNAAGYQLEWSASSATMDSGANTIGAYTPAIPNTPETWSVGSTDSEWGARLSSASTDVGAEWGTDSTSEKWLNVSTSTRQIVSRSSQTPPTGSDEIVQFKSEVGSGHMQPEGSYSVNVTATATTL